MMITFQCNRAVPSAVKQAFIEDVQALLDNELPKGGDWWQRSADGCQSISFLKTQLREGAAPSRRRWRFEERWFGSLGPDDFENLGFQVQQRGKRPTYWVVNPRISDKEITL